jgi:mono/diheme cytochrome c family protein
VLAAVVGFQLIAVAGAQPIGAPPGISGNAERGKTLFTDVYRCAACHGSRGETGSPRLVPMKRSEAGFISYLRTPPTPLMPSYAQVPEPDLADIYAHLRSIQPDAPPLETIPLLEGVLKRIPKGK